MHSARAVATLTLVCLLCVPVVSPVLAGTTGADRPVGPVASPGSLSDAQLRATAAQETGPNSAPPGFLQTTVDPDAVVMRADVGTDGTAEWTVEYRLRLDDDNATAAFESLREDVETNASAFTARFADGMRRTVWSAENATGREMALENVTVDADRQTFGQEYGVVTYSFGWTNFATTDGDRLRAGDALAELFLDSETTLVLAYPGEYTVESVQPRPSENRSDAVVWRGPVDFGPDEPTLVAAPGGETNDGVLRMVAGGIVLLLALVAGGWLVRQRREVERSGGEITPQADASGDRDAPDPTDREGGDDGGAADGSDETAAAAGDDSEESSADDESADEGGTSEPPEELLSNEERVLKLLNESGGRIKQQRIVEELDWTAAKTSQVIGDLRDDDAVETFRIGRENVVTLPEESDLMDGE